MMRTIEITACFLLIFAAVSSAHAEIDGQTALRNMLEAESKVSFIAHEVTTLARGPAVTSEQIVYRAGMKGMRMEYLSPPQLKGEIRADDGKTLAHYIPQKKVLHIRPSRIASRRNWAEHGHRFFRPDHLDVQLVGRDKIAGRSAYVVEVRPRADGKEPRRKFWIDTRKWIKLRTEEIAPDGTVLSMTYFTKIDFVDSIPDSKFHIEPPPGVSVEKEREHPHEMSMEEARRHVDFTILEPSYVPPGFKFTGAGILPFREGKLIVLRYTDGVSTISMFQTPGERLNPKFLEHLREGPSRSDAGVYTWRVRDMNLTIVGRISQDEIRRMAASVK
jgi:outer membrane lipoprotein-sorting protein